MADMSTSARDQATAQGMAMPDGRYPIRSMYDLHNAIMAVGRAKGGPAGRAAVRRFIMGRAHAMGSAARAQIPDTWNADGSLKQ